jgi:hypothetical protein
MGSKQEHIAFRHAMPPREPGQQLTAQRTADVEQIKRNEQAPQVTRDNQQCIHLEWIGGLEGNRF